MDEAGKQLAVSGDMANSVELGSGGSELIITRRSDDGISSKTLGSREYLRYYRQKLRPSPANGAAITAALASRFVGLLCSFYKRIWIESIDASPVFSINNIQREQTIRPQNCFLIFRYRSMGLATVQSKEQMVRMKVLKEMRRSGVEAMRSKMGMKSNVIRNLPKNCTY